ncbi:hypothetical protein DLJ74_19355 [Gracilibacillus dipsosauri]|uniref:Fibronectin type-III domain-containing protein n=1 Tax=Gracilibacillus dipsosauri TaxID=178340 RepID=A0A317KV42_9BACI|nr:hypothetical protein DLJ74_19355 [Gracilibacillus dipsosauri]
MEIDQVTTNSYSVTGLTASTQYEFYVTALGEGGTESDPSNTVQATTTA